MFKWRAFTLLELLVAFAITVLLLVIAIPSFHEMIQTNRAVQLSNAFTQSLQFARDEAIKQSKTIMVCPISSDNANVCGSVNEWVNGWLVLSNTERLQAHTDLPKGTVVNTSLTNITFNPAGVIDSKEGIVTLATPSCAGNHGRLVFIAGNGEVSVANANCYI